MRITKRICQMIMLALLFAVPAFAHANAPNAPSLATAKEKFIGPQNTTINAATLAPVPIDTSQLFAVQLAVSEQRIGNTLDPACDINRQAVIAQNAAVGTKQRVGQNTTAPPAVAIAATPETSINRASLAHSGEPNAPNPSNAA